MSAETDFAYNLRARKLRRRERRLQRRDDDDSDSEDENSSSAAAASTSSPAAGSSSTASITSTSSDQITLPSSTNSPTAPSTTPTAIPVTEDPRPPPFSTTPISTLPTTEASITSSTNGDQPNGLPINPPSGLPGVPIVSEQRQPSSGMETKIAVAAGVTSAVIVLLGVLACVLLRRRYKRRNRPIEDSDSINDAASDRILVRGAIRPATSLLWRPWSRRAPPNPQRAPTASFVSNDDHDYFIANGMRRDSDVPQTPDGRQGWYSIFSGSDRIVSALTSYTRRKSTAILDPTTNEKAFMPGSVNTARRSTLSEQADSVTSPPTRRYRESKFLESRFSTSDRTNSIAPTSDTISMFFNRDSVARSEQARRTSSALEREYVSMPAAAKLRASTATSSGGLSTDSGLQPPPVPKVPWKYSVGSLRSWLEERNMSRQNISRLP